MIPFLVAQEQGHSLHYRDWKGLAVYFYLYHMYPRMCSRGGLRTGPARERMHCGGVAVSKTRIVVGTWFPLDVESSNTNQCCHLRKLSRMVMPADQVSTMRGTKQLYLLFVDPKPVLSCLADELDPEEVLEGPAPQP